MIKKFWVNNYKIFREKACLDFSDVKDYDYSTNGVRDGYINTAIIYGKNGSGKSMLGLALFDVTLHLVDKAKIPEQTMNYLPAMSEEDSLAEFNYTFAFDKQEVDYYYKKDKDARLVYEELKLDGKSLFSCDFKTNKIEIFDREALQAGSLNFTIYNEKNPCKISVLRYIYANTMISASSLVKKIIDFVGHMLWFRSLTEGNSFIGFHNSGAMLSQEIIATGNLKKFEEFLRFCELDYTLEELHSPLLGASVVGVKYGNKKLDFLQVASSGTRLLMLFFYWSLHFNEISFLFLDEFNAYYHYSLSYKIASIVRDLKCQAVMSTHDTSLLESDVLRPDCYFIMYANKIQSLPNLTKRELREVHNLEKLYRSYGFTVQ